MELFTEDQQKVLKSIWIPIIIFLVAHYVVNEFSAADLLWITDSQYTLTHFLPMLFLIGWEFVVYKQWSKLAIYTGISLAWIVLLYVAGLDDYNEQVFYTVGAVGFLLTRSYLLHRYKKLLQVAVVFFILGSGATIELWRLFPRMADRYDVSEKNGIFFFLSLVVLPVIFYVSTFLLENIIGNPAYLKRYRDKTAITDPLTFLVVYIASYTVLLKSCIVLSEIKQNYILTQTMGLNIWLFVVQIIIAVALIVVSLPVWWRTIVGRMLTTTRNSYLLMLFHIMPIFNLLPFMMLLLSEDVNTTREENIADYMGISRKIPVLVVRIIGTLFTLFGFLTIARSYADNEDDNVVKMLILFIVILLGSRIVLLWAIKKDQVPVPFYILGIVIAFTDIYVHYILSSALIFDVVFAITSLVLISEIFDPKVDDAHIKQVATISDLDLLDAIGSEHH